MLIRDPVKDGPSLTATFGALQTSAVAPRILQLALKVNF